MIKKNIKHHPVNGGCDGGAVALSPHNKKVPGSIHGLTSEGHFSEPVLAGWLADSD